MDKGCQSYREDCIRSHGQTRAHLVAETLHMEAKAAELNGGIEAALQEQVTLEKTALLAAMRSMYFLVRRQLPHTTNFAEFLELQRVNGCAYLNALFVDGTNGYTSERTMQEFVLVIGEFVLSLKLSTVHLS